MPLLLCIPFVGIVLSIALGPLFAPRIWHLHYGKIALGWMIAGILNVVYFYSIETAIHGISHTLLLEYLPFICLMLALYTLSGGMRVHINAKPTPLLNVGILLLGAVFSNLVGTSGASMILIRPFLKLNQHRTHRTHQVIFFIFAVSNIGGVLTPLGDPPLFMGFIKGINFFWTVREFMSVYLVTMGLLLSTFYMIDRWLCELEHRSQPLDQKIQISIEGKMHGFLLLVVASLVFQSGSWNPGEYFHVLGVDIAVQNVFRDVGAVAIAGLSLLLTPLHIRRGHEFHWEPFLEVAKLFLAIFITLIPVIELAQHYGDKIKNSLTPSLYFWMTGVLSAFLDNAPTYLVFFNLAGGDPAELMTSKAHILTAISLGSVYMGAMTYIGNAPNFMVASIARNYQVRMPSFFGYMGWSLAILTPILLLIDWLFLI